jgi:hypothetical protein
MELIDKAVVVAEIEKRFDEYSSSILKHYDACTEARATLGCGEYTINVDEFRKYMKGE